MPAILIKSPDKTGYLLKEGGTWKNVARRYFVLKDSDLFYFKDKNDMNPTGFIHVDECRIQIPKGKQQRSFAFQLSWRDHKEFMLFANSGEELTEWLLALNQAKELGQRYSEDWIGYGEKAVEDDVHVHPPVYISNPDRTGYVQIATDKKIEKEGEPRNLIRMYLVLKDSDLFVFTDDEATRPEEYCYIQ
eukprot:TRINITY_DN8574_c1_g1_i2.p2 TRINITY_DN8574_c1_g1~~TRINITY_DN8574_c1_g1_i2.p2  ORF type:complete len:190 (-),score=64.70 TRINITY_DN8574_c1_g1_i2:159-728(-)